MIKVRGGEVDEPRAPQVSFKLDDNDGAMGPAPIVLVLGQAGARLT